MNKTLAEYVTACKDTECPMFQFYKNLEDRSTSCTLATGTCDTADLVDKTSSYLYVPYYPKSNDEIIKELQDQLKIKQLKDQLYGTGSSSSGGSSGSTSGGVNIG